MSLENAIKNSIADLWIEEQEGCKCDAIRQDDADERVNYGSRIMEVAAKLTYCSSRLREAVRQ